MISLRAAGALNLLGAIGGSVGAALPGSPARGRRPEEAAP